MSEGADQKKQPEVAHVEEEPRNAKNSAMDSELQKYTADEAIYIDEDTSKRLKRKIDKRVLPVLIITYMCQALDKGTLSFASIMGLIEDTNLVGQQYSWLTTCVYIAILVAEFPTNWVIQKVPTAKYLSLNVVLWGACVACQAACSSFAPLLVLRILLGIFETCCQPIFIIISSMWYRRDEQAKTISLWYCMNGMNQIVGGLLAYCFSLIQGAKMKGWQVFFLTYGLVTVVYGMFISWWLPDSPMKAKCWSEEDKMLMVERVRENQTSLQNKKFKWDQFWEALKDPQTWAYALLKFLTALPSGGLGAYQGILVSSFGFTTLQTQLLAMVQGAWQIFILLSSLWVVKKCNNQTILVMFCYPILSVIGTVVLIAVPYDDTVRTRAALLFCFYICLSYWATDSLTLSLLSRNVAGRTKKSVAIAMCFIGWACGNAVGPQTFIASDAPRYPRAFATQLACYIVVFIILISLRLWLMRCNRNKDEKIQQGEAEEDKNLQHAFDDLTDFQNQSFRYAY